MSLEILQRPKLSRELRSVQLSLKSGSELSLTVFIQPTVDETYFARDID